MQKKQWRIVLFLAARRPLELRLKVEGTRKAPSLDLEAATFRFKGNPCVRNFFCNVMDVSARFNIRMRRLPKLTMS